MSEQVHLTAYFERIGFSGSIAPTLATLEALHALHPASIPFENLNPLLGLPVELDQASLEQKLIHDRRGGYCYEHNMMFMRVLRELDFKVTGYAARVLWNHAEGEERPLSHMVLGVEAGGALYLADVGFGSMTLTAPLRLRAGIEQETPFARYRLVGESPSYRLEAEIQGAWKAVYAFDLVERTYEDFVALNAATYPNFANMLAAARTDRDFRYSLRDFRFSTYPHEGGELERRFLTSVPEVREVLSETFGINLPPAELLDPAIERLLAERPPEQQST
ncbi:MAG: arylamine N-acetyltransferase [Devosia nanyangense]|nr:arylamine N-acetyltransferase [Devosia nanyangense]